MKCKECGLELHRKIESYDIDRLGNIICEKCGHETNEVLKCKECETPITEKEVKGYIRVYPDGQIDIYSVLCDKCKEKKREEI